MKRRGTQSFHPTEILRCAQNDSEKEGWGEDRFSPSSLTFDNVEGVR